MLSWWATSLIFVLAAANPYWAEGKSHLEQLRYPQAEERLRLAAAVPTNTREERREIFHLLARAQIAQGRQTDAEASYRQLLLVDPSAPAPQDVSPKIAAAFQHAKAALFPPRFARLTLLASGADTLELALVDPWAQGSSIVYLERAEKDDAAGHAWTERSFPASELVRVPLEAVTPGNTRAYYAEVRDKNGGVLASLGTASAPRTRAGPPPRLAEGPPSWRPAVGTATTVAPPPPRWPGWLLTGTAIVAAGVGTYLAVSAGADSRAAGQATSASATRALDERARSQAVWAYALGAGSVASAGAGLYFLWPRNESER